MNSSVFNLVLQTSDAAKVKVQFCVHDLCTCNWNDLFLFKSMIFINAVYYIMTYKWYYLHIYISVSNVDDVWSVFHWTKRFDSC